MEQAYDGVCGSCDSEFSVVVGSTPGDAIPDTCPFCGSAAEYNEVSDSEED